MIESTFRVEIGMAPSLDRREALKQVCGNEKFVETLPKPKEKFSFLFAEKDNVVPKQTAYILNYVFA